ncbi:MAG: hypothetical protein JWO11_3587 [Nocardioides sp.]|nr:hypothetical protein [Nocardioides sp.]
MSVDPFNSGSSCTLDSITEPDRQRRAALAVMHKFTGTEDMWLVLSTLGLDRVAEELLVRRALRLSDTDPLPATPPAPESAVADEPGLFSRVIWCGSGDHMLPGGRGECMPCRKRRRLARAARKLVRLEAAS